jgi:superfamily II DNA/RNA helicase
LHIQTTIDAAIAATDRVIIFVPSKFWCQVLCDIFALSHKPVCQFHSDLDEAEKSSSLSAFERSPIAILVSTTALSCGMNVAGVNLVIVFASVYSTENLLQSGGRAARCGGVGDVLFLTTRYFLHKMETSNKFGSRQVAALARSPYGFAAALEQLYLSYQ